MVLTKDKKIKLAILCGGCSAEHDVSLTSAVGILSNLNRDRYRVLPIKITRGGKWLLLDSGLDYPTPEKLDQASGPALLTGDPTLKGFFRLDTGKTIPVDVVFPVLHGPFGEDGTVQGLLALSGLPCVGAGILGSALGMDKILMKQIFIQSDLETPDFIWFLKSAWKKESDAIVSGIRSEIGYPCFVKPANLGSSVGISKVKTEASLREAIDFACRYDRRVLVEKAIAARELECAVLGNDEPTASVVGEILPSNEFYDYAAKYEDDQSQTVIPADIPEDVSERIRLWAVLAFRALDCAGLARVDFLMDKTSRKLYINEINTLPGFTPISMYPKLWEKSDLPYSRLLDRLIDLAIERDGEQVRLQVQH